MTVGLVLISHSARLAEGVVELANQMAPNVDLLPAGGTADGGIGTDYDTVLAAIGAADSGAGVVLLYDVGSAQMTAEMAAESLAESGAVSVVDAPLVEGAVAAAVSAQGDADLAAVAAAARSAGQAAGSTEPAEASDVAVATDRGPTTDTEAGESPASTELAELTELVLHNDIGLHARPAALLARQVADLDADVRIRFGEQEADAASVLALMSLGARQGDRIEVRATGAHGNEALQRISDLVDRNFEA